jgi:hypothetical protein
MLDYDPAKDQQRAPGFGTKTRMTDISAIAGRFDGMSVVQKSYTNLPRGSEMSQNQSMLKELEEVELVDMGTV